MPNNRRRPLEANNPISRRRRATMRHAQKTRGKMTARDRQMALQRTQRKYLRGAIIDSEIRAAAERRLDGLPDSAFVGERVRSFVAVSSWFWYCYPCAQPGDDSNESQARYKKFKGGTNHGNEAIQQGTQAEQEPQEAHSQRYAAESSSSAADDPRVYPHGNDVDANRIKQKLIMATKRSSKANKSSRTARSASPASSAWNGCVRC